VWCASRRVESETQSQSSGGRPTIAAGEFVQASGSWVNDRMHGQQFRATSNSGVKTAIGTRPGHADLLDPAFITAHARHTGMQVGREWAWCH
jgi:hypothetical protein